MPPMPNRIRGGWVAYLKYQVIAPQVLTSSSRREKANLSLLPTPGGPPPNLQRV